MQGRWGKDLECTHIPESEGVLESPRKVPVKEQSCSQASWAPMMGVSELEVTGMGRCPIT